MSDLTLLTWNIALGQPSTIAPSGWDIEYNTDKILDEIERYDADIICLQEIATPQFIDFLSNQYLAGKLVKTHSGFTTIFLRKGRIADQLVDPLSMLTLGPTSGLKIRLGSRQLTVFSVHLPPSRENSLARENSLLDLANQLDLRHPVILAGDMNLREEENGVLTSRGLIDAYCGTVNLQQYATFHTEKNQFHSDIPMITARFDRVFYQNLNLARYQLIGNSIQSKPGHYLSDHFGILVQFSL